MKFENSALTLVGGFVSVLVLAALLSPPTKDTASPRATIGYGEHLVLASGLAPGDLYKEFNAAAGATGSTARSLNRAFGRLDYHLDKVKSGHGLVPRVFLASLPGDLAAVPENKTRKAIFFQATLPLVLQVNEEILTDRRRLWRLRYYAALGQKPAAADHLWLSVMADRYNAEEGDIDDLISRVDIIPPSLALAQAAEESGWGTSRFAKEGNALFGQWTYSSQKSLKPLNRDAGKKHNVKAFTSLIDSVRAYSVNLNSHRAYKDFRHKRQSMRRQGKALDGRKLAGQLLKYSERGADYVSALRGLIDFNALAPLDAARLDDGQPRKRVASII